MGKNTNQGGIKYILVSEKTKTTATTAEGGNRPDNEAKEEQEQQLRLTPIYNPEEVERFILERNQRHFSQAQGTPFTTEPLLELFGHNGTTAEANQLLNGEIDTSSIETTDAVKLILEALSTSQGRITTG